ncbi:LLM class flavin-dependent oxidoreductase [Pseudonocardia halophobica]|uniref:LLM class flavin-dependent oxidoreductase n=1 Tax=Pseudonocardia halophobica TaxID=29401 RepID=UPI003D90E3A8
MATGPIGAAVIPGAGWRAADVREVARAAEDAGFAAVLSAEVNSDTLTTAQVMGGATSRVRVGTWVADI